MLAARAQREAVIAERGEAVTELGPIAFVGAAGSGEFRGAGGTNSYLRRIALELAALGESVDFLLFGRTSGEWLSEAAGIRSRSFRSVLELVAWLRNQRYRHLIQIYARPAARLTLGFHGRMNPGTAFHSFAWSWQENWARRQAQTLDRLLIPNDGALFAVSHRLWRSLARLHRRAVCLLPPVPRAFYVPAERPKAGNKMTVSYLGRLDPAKGAVDAIGLLRRLARSGAVRAVVHGIYVSGDASSTAVHEELLRQSEIEYSGTAGAEQGGANDVGVAAALAKTDVLLLPFRRLSSTIDTPALLLEGMAASCAIVAPRVGDIPDLYGESPFLYDRFDEDGITRLLLERSSVLQNERRRIQARVAELAFWSDLAAQRFRDALRGSLP